MATISVVTITKNSEGRISDVAHNALEIGSEFVVVDTGSTDNTLQDAEDAGANVFQFQGAFDYSTARNFGTDAAKGEWVLHLDDDEWFDPRLRDRLYDTVAGSTADIFTLWACDFINGKVKKSYQPVGRLFRRKKAMHKGLVHEDLYPVGDFGVPNLHIIHHTELRDRGDILDKLRKRLATREADQLIHKQTNTTPDAIAEWFSRVRHLYGFLEEPQKSRFRDAAEEVYRFASENHLVTPTVRITAAYFQSDRIRDFRKAIRILTDGLSAEPDTFQYHFALGRIYFTDCKIQESLSALQRALKKNPTCFFIYLLLASLHLLQGDNAASERAQAKAWDVYPEFPCAE